MFNRRCDDTVAAERILRTGTAERWQEQEALRNTQAEDDGRMARIGSSVVGAIRRLQRSRRRTSRVAGMVGDRTRRLGACAKACPSICVDPCEQRLLRSVTVLTRPRATHKSQRGRTTSSLLQVLIANTRRQKLCPDRKRKNILRTTWPGGIGRIMTPISSCITRLWMAMVSFDLHWLA